MIDEWHGAKRIEQSGKKLPICTADVLELEWVI